MARARETKKLGWGFIDQAASSAASLLLTIAVARLFGAQALGVVAIGFSAYLVSLGVMRGLIVQPLIISTSSQPADDVRLNSRHALTTTLLGAAIIAIAMTAIGLALQGSIGRGLLLFALWVPFAIVQDLCRSTLFRDSLGRVAAVNDILWLAVMAVTLIGAWQLRTDWAVVGAWGLGAVVATIAGIWATGMRPSSPRVALSHWRHEQWPLGRWLFASGIAYNATAQANVFVVGGVLGPAALGGLRVVQTAFAPLTLLSPAVSLPALPAIARRYASNVTAARRLAVQTSMLLILITGTYVLAISFIGDSLLTTVFGSSFGEYRDLILPIALQQVVLACGIGFDLLLRAGSHGRSLFTIRLICAAVGLGTISIATTTDDLPTVAWSMMGVAGLSSALLIVAAVRMTQKSIEQRA